jgi:hypothetical protein
MNGCLDIATVIIILIRKVIQPFDRVLYVGMDVSMKLEQSKYKVQEQ